MDFLEQKMLEMNSRLDQTQVSVETLQELMSQLSTDVRSMLQSSGQGVPIDIQRSHSNGNSLGQTLADSGHKDVLQDEDGMATTGLSDRTLGPDMQIRRLTAQLTAAYGRIAALEEQLLMRRIQTQNTI
jgi:repressor of nif and glnA expression